MHPALVRLPAVVALAAALSAVPAVALATADPTSDAPHTVSGHEGTSEHAHGGSTGTSGEVEPTVAATATTHDMGEMAGLDDMEGMDHGGGTEGADHPSGAHDEHGEGPSGHTPDPAPDGRPRAAVLSGFTGLNAAVLVTAAVLRRRDRARPRHRPRPTGTPTPA